MQTEEHVINQLYGKEYDFNCGHTPSITYMLATLPRSGSTFCSIHLWRTGLLGAPMEYLNFRVMGKLFNRLGYQPTKQGYLSQNKVRKYWRDIQLLRTSPNGVFGYKMFTSNYLEIAKHHPRLLGMISPNRVIYLTRKDEIGQAISFSRAARSKIWFAGFSNSDHTEYDFDHISFFHKKISLQKRSWENIFALTNCRPIRIYYEDLLLDPETVIKDAKIQMGIETLSEPIFIPLIERQTDEKSHAWRKQYMQDLEKHHEET